MTDTSESDSDSSPEIQWSILEDELSAGGLESLQQHLQGRAPPKVSSTSSAGESDGEGESCTDRTRERKVVLPASNLAYKIKDYWDSRFQTEQEYDWLATYGDLAEHLHRVIPKEARVLIVGCGNSSLSADMYDDGYRNLLSTDFSAVVIDKMRARHEASRPGLRWEEMDMLALDAEDGSFDAVVDKAAMDALMVGKEDPWNPGPASVEQAHRMCKEVSRVLAPSGVFVQLSFEQEHFRGKFLSGEYLTAATAAADAAADADDEDEDDRRLGLPVGGGEEEDEEAFCGVGDGCGGRYGWDVCAHNIQQEGGCFGHFFYVMRKRG